MQNIPLKVTIAIPAYNEGKNIKNLLQSILVQHQNNFLLKKIIVLSDGSSDNTVEEAQSVESELIEVLNDGEQHGKVARLNQAFEIAEEDILIQIDADSAFKTADELDRMTEPFIIDPATDLVCGWHEPLPPKNLIERLGFFGAMSWQKAVEYLGSKGEFYRCTGQLRAFSRNFYSQFRMPLDVGPSEDLYSFYYAKLHGFNIIVKPDAIVYYKLAGSLFDYIKQMKRFMNSHDQAAKFFDPALRDAYETMTPQLRLRFIFQSAKEYPFHILPLYLILQFFTMVVSKIVPNQKTWAITRSSKSIDV